MVSVDHFLVIETWEMCQQQAEKKPLPFSKTKSQKMGETKNTNWCYQPSKYSKSILISTPIAYYYYFYGLDSIQFEIQKYFIDDCCQGPIAFHPLTSPFNFIPPFCKRISQGLIYCDSLWESWEYNACVMFCI